MWGALALLIILSLIAGACAPAPTPAPKVEPTKAPLKVAFVYVAPIGDLGWTWAHDQGRLMMEEELGVETAYIENVPEGPDAERVIRDFAQKGYDLIITTSFGFMDPTITVAREFPDKWFVHISGYKTAPNVSTVFGGIEEARYLSGLVAGAMTESNILGYVAAFPIPEVVRGINAFAQGVREVNPDAEVRVVWTNTWFDPVKEKEAAEALLDQGSDIIAQHQDTTEPQKAAKDRGALSIGYDSDMSQFVGDTVLTSPIWNWGPKYVEIARQIMAGTYKSEAFYGHLKDGTFDLAVLSPRVPAEIQKLVEQRRQELIDGKFNIFCGPFNGANGVEVLPAGRCMTLEEKLSMDFFIEGVRGEAPAQGRPLEGEAAPAAMVAVAPVAKPRVAFVYVGPVGDLGWSYAHDQGRLYLAKELGVETAYSELVAEGPDAERVIRDYAQKGYDVIFATSFGYMDSVIEVARGYPKTVFLHATGYKTADNVGIYDGRGYQGWYLAGIVAGKMTRTNTLGYVAPYPIPEVVRNLNAFALGARSVNPAVEVRPVWIFTWFDPVKEREAAQALIDQGADVIARESDSVEPDKLAEEAGVYAVGYNAISADVAPNAVLTAPIWNWGVYYKQAVEEIMAGTWQPTPVWWGLKDGLLELAPFGKMVPDDVKVLVEKEKQRIISGEFDVFVGPIKDNTGVERVPAGVTMTDDEKLAFDWLVEGVRGTVPK
jgi:basic membrane protein A